MATLVKTPSGTWKALVRKRGWPTSARTFRTKRDAEDWARRTEDEMVRGVHVFRAGTNALLFGAALDRYLSEITPTKKPTTQRAERTKAVPLRQFFGKYSLSAVTSEQAARYRDARLNLGLRPNTVRLELALASHLYNIALKEWRVGLASNPFAAIRKPSTGEGRSRRLGHEEERQLRRSLLGHSNPMLRWIFEIALETGMRSSEISGLCIHHVDISRRIVRLFDTKNDGNRTVPLTKLARDVLAAAIANPARPAGCDLVFFGEPGRDGIRRPYSFNKVWMGIKNQLGIPDFRFHDLRHEAVCRFVERGLSDQEVSAISGHKSMQMLKRYTHLRAEDLVPKLDSSERSVA